MNASRPDSKLRGGTSSDETALLAELVRLAGLEQAARERISAQAAALVRSVRAEARHSLMEGFLAEYGLSTAEGVGLMCLAEALLRVPDAETIDDLIRDKIEPSDWGAHLGRSSSSLINASTWALMLTGRLLDDDTEDRPAGALRGLIRRLGEPVVRVAVAQAMKALGQQFVLGQTIGEAVRRGQAMLARGHTYSYDMLGEAARTSADAVRYQHSYANALMTLKPGCGADIRTNPGISVKLSALHPRYEYGQRERVMAELVPRVLQLARLARDGRMGLNIDAEEADRLELSLDIIEVVLADPGLAGWDGFGVVVQAYGKRARDVLDWLHALARRLDRRIMVRLVKGAYWDGEIKHAQELGLAGFPVFTRKIHTDVSYIACARKLLQMTDRIYPQFATHNAHTCEAVLAMTTDRSGFEFQRLHGMGEALHRILMAQSGMRCRIYAPVGAHRDLLAYLVRRLLENGANSSFVNQIADERVAPEAIARDPFEVLAAQGGSPNPAIAAPPALFEPVRRNSRGRDLNDPRDVAELEEQRSAFRSHRWQAAAMIAPGHGNATPPPSGPAAEIRNPADPSDTVGKVTQASEAQVAAALAASPEGFWHWTQRPVNERAATLRQAAVLFEQHAAELYALCTREAGKTLRDAISEVREAVDFLRYYAAEAERLAAGGGAGQGRGVFVCISPWNFPLAIFTGQVAAALAAGNAVIAKPAEQTPLIAARAVGLLHEAGVPAASLQFLPGEGAIVGAALTRSPSIAGVLFTGSTEVAQLINRSLAEHAAPDAVLVAETGGLNAMVVDSTALPEQAVRDILASAFQSAGQRCSSLRVLYVQRDVSQRILDMLGGAMDELVVGDPWSLATDVGPVIDEDARRSIQRYCDKMADAGRLVKKLRVPQTGRFVAPHVLKVSGIQDVEREIFGPVLHVATFEAEALDQVVDAINARGYGLTFGLHTRIDDRVQRVVDRIRAGNIYVNRNQIGAVVGSQPFGGEGLSGTGPKAGGPHYLPRLLRHLPAALPASGTPPSDARTSRRLSPSGFATTLATVLKRFDTTRWAARTDRIGVLRQLLTSRLGPHAQALFSAVEPCVAGPRAMPGPTGESNQLRLAPRAPALCLGPGWHAALSQAVQAMAVGGAAILIVDEPPERLAPGQLEAWQAAGLPMDIVDAGMLPDDPAWLLAAVGFGVVAYAGLPGPASALRQSLARHEGDIKPLVTDLIAPERYVLERLLCVDTTAAGGNASLLAASEVTSSGSRGDAPSLRQC